MPNHLSNLGILHTVISILAVIFAVVALFRDGKIDPRSGPGRWYILLTIGSCLTSFGVMKTGHFTPAHGLSIIVLLLLLIGVNAQRWFRIRGEKTEVVIMSITLFLSFIPAITETLTRIPASHPIAESQNASIIKMSYLFLLLIFSTGIYLQINSLRKREQIPL